MQKPLVHWRKIVYSFCGLKVLATLLLPVGGDFINWVTGASSVLQTILAGRFPGLSTYGVYIGIMIILAPFFWLWTALPIQHPNLASLVQHTVSTVSLAFVMKTPILLCDVATLILLLRVVRHITNSEQVSIVAGLTWFVNPFNFYVLYYLGAMDVIPIALLLLAITFELNGRWFICGVVTVVSGLLRLFAFVVYPFFIPITKNKPSGASLIVGSALPIALAIGVLYLSGGTLATVFNIPAQQFWLLEFLGWNVWGMQFVRLSPVLVLFQLYVAVRFWRPNANVVHLTSVSLLALMLGATLYGGEGVHFLWVSPFLSACVAMSLEDAWIYVLTFLCAILWWTPMPILLETLLTGAFYAMKATYLLKLNLLNLRISQQQA